MIQIQSHTLKFLVKTNSLQQFTIQVMSDIQKIELLTETPYQLPFDQSLEAYSTLISTPYFPQINYNYSKQHILQSETNLTCFCAYSNFERQEFGQAKQISQRKQKVRTRRPNYTVIKTTMCVDLIKKQQFLRYCKPLLKLLVQISRKKCNLPPAIQFNQRQLAIWQSVKVQYPRYVLRYDEIFHQSNQSVIYIITEDFHQYLPISHFIERARLAHKTQCFSREESIQQQVYNNFQCLNQKQILIVMNKIIKALSDILSLEKLLNDKGMQQLGFFDHIPEQNESQQQRHMYLLKYLNPEQDIRVHPITLDVKICNFGLKQDLDVCTYEYKMQLADTNFIYRHPRNANYWECEYLAKNQRYVQKYVDEGLKSEDLVWLCGMLMYRLITGQFPLKDENNNIITKLCRNDFQNIQKQLSSISEYGVFQLCHERKGYGFLELANQMLIWRCKIQPESGALATLSKRFDELQINQKKSLQNETKLLQIQASTDYHQYPYRKKIRQPVKSQQWCEKQSIKNGIKLLKKRIKLTIQPLYMAHQKLILAWQTFGKQKINDFQDLVFFNSSIIGFKLIAEVRRRCQQFYDHESNQICVSKILAKLRVRLERYERLETLERKERKETKDKIKLIIKQMRAIGTYREFLLKTIKACNAFILNYCQLLRQLPIQINSTQNPLINVCRMVEQFIQCLYWTKRTTNTRHKSQIIENNENKNKMKQLSEIIKSEMKNCPKQIQELVKKIGLYTSNQKWDLSPAEKQFREKMRQKQIHLTYIGLILDFDKRLENIQLEYSLEPLEEFKTMLDYNCPAPDLKIFEKVKIENGVQDLSLTYPGSENWEDRSVNSAHQNRKSF